MDGAEGDPGGVGKREGRAPIIGTGREIVGAIDRVNDPGPAGLGLAGCAFFPEDAVFRAHCLEHARDEALGRPVRIRNNVRDRSLLLYVDAHLAQAPGQAAGVIDKGLR